MNESDAIPGERSQARTLIPLLLILLLGLASIAGLLFYFSNALNDATRYAMRDRVAIAKRHEAEWISEMAMDYSYWDEAYLSLVGEPDPEFADDNIGSYLTEFSYMDLSLVADRRRNITFAFNQGVPYEPPLGQMLDAGLNKILAAERAASSSTEGEYGVILFRGNAYLFGVNSFVTNYRDEFEDGSYLALAMELDHDYIARMAEKYQIPGLRLTSNTQLPDYLSLSYLDVHGNPIKTITWQDPGTANPLDYDMTWIVAALVLTMGMLATSIVRTEMTRQKQYASILTQIAFKDSLTEVDNRRAFFERGRQELRRSESRGQPSTLLLLDVDHFKTINDRFGHAAGDDTLVKLAQRLQAELRQYDLLARIGGEEFAILLPQTPLGVAANTAERLREASQELSDGRISLTVSIGIAESTTGESLDSILARADKALYAAKSAGRNRCEVAPPGDAFCRL